MPKSERKNERFGWSCLTLSPKGVWLILLSHLSSYLSCVKFVPIDNKRHICSPKKWSPRFLSENETAARPHSQK